MSNALYISIKDTIVRIITCMSSYGSCYSCLPFAGLQYQHHRKITPELLHQAIPKHKTKTSLLSSVAELIRLSLH